MTIPMLVLHTHWQPPRATDTASGLLFWAETSDAEPPARSRGRPGKHPRPKDHPFCAPTEALRALLAPRPYQAPGRPAEVVLRLPSVGAGSPLPSPMLLHDWNLGSETAPDLQPWRVRGLWLPAEEALSALIGLPADEELPSSLALGADTRYWRVAASLVLEVLAAQHLAPGLVLADEARGVYHARWLPVLDGPDDAPRLVRLTTAMPPVCRSEAVPGDGVPPPSRLLDSFLKVMVDALARVWGNRPPVPREARDDPMERWLAALFDADPTVHLSPAQMKVLANSHRAWLRNLHIAGDAAFRIAFRLEAPGQQAESGTTSDRPVVAADGWYLHFLLQARDDPSLLVPSEVVWQSRGSVLNRLGRRFEQPQERLLAGLGYAGRLYPPLSAGLTSACPTGAALDTQQAYTFLRETAPLLEEAGFGVLVPPWWTKPGTRLGVRLRLRAARQESTEATGSGHLTLDNLVQYEWELALGETTLTRAEFEALVALKAPLVQMRGQWVQLDPEQVEAAIRFWEKRQAQDTLSLQDGLRWGLGAEDEAGGLPVTEVTAEGWLAEWLERLNGQRSLEQLPQPAGLNGHAAALPTLRLFLAGLSATAGTGRLPGRRHGPGQDDPDPGAAAAREGTTRQSGGAGPAGLPHLGGDQLGARGAPLCPGADHLGAPGRRPPAGRRVPGRSAPGGPGADQLCLAAPRCRNACSRSPGRASSWTRPRTSRIPLPSRRRRCANCAPTSAWR